MNYPLGDYDIIERTLGKIVMTDPAEHRKAVEAMIRLRQREMLGDAAAELAYTRQCATTSVPRTLPWEELSPEQREGWRVYVKSLQEAAA